MNSIEGLRVGDETKFVFHFILEVISIGFVGLFEAVFDVRHFSESFRSQNLHLT